MKSAKRKPLLLGLMLVTEDLSTKMIYFSVDIKRQNGTKCSTVPDNINSEFLSLLEIINS